MPRNLEAGNEYFNNPGVPGSNLLPPERRAIPPSARGPRLRARTCRPRFLKEPSGAT